MTTIVMVMMIMVLLVTKIMTAAAPMFLKKDYDYDRLDNNRVGDGESAMIITTTKNA